MTSKTTDAALEKEASELPYREVEEARSDYQLSPQQWVTLKKRFQGDQWKTRLGEMETAWRRDVEQTLRPKLREEMLSELRAKVDKETIEKARSEMAERFAAEERQRQATPAQREAAKEFVRDLEIDCRALAETASRMREYDQRRQARARLLRAPLFYLLLIGLLPFAWWLHSQLYPFTHPGFFAFVVPWLVVTIMLGSSTKERLRVFDRDIANHSKASSDYLIAADSARRVRLVDIDLAATRGEVQQKIAEISREKECLDEKFHADTRTLAAARVSVLDDLNRSIDAEKILSEDRRRIAAQFDELDPPNETAALRRS